MGKGILFDWFYDRLRRDGTLTLTQKDFTDVFQVDVTKELDAFKQLCKTKGLVLTVDTKHKTLTFQLLGHPWQTKLDSLTAEMDSSTKQLTNN